MLHKAGEVLTPSPVRQCKVLILGLTWKLLGSVHWCAVFLGRRDHVYCSQRLCFVCVVCTCVTIHLVIIQLRHRWPMDHYPLITNLSKDPQGLLNGMHLIVLLITKSNLYIN